MMTPSPLMDIALLQGHAPYTLAGFAAFRSVIDSDGAVPFDIQSIQLTGVAQLLPYCLVVRQHMGVDLFDQLEQRTVLRHFLLIHRRHGLRK